MNKLFLTIITAALACFNAAYAGSTAKDKVVVAYVTSWTNIMPDPTLMTHINYAFGHVSDTFDGVRIDNEERLRSIVALKKQCPALKVMLSIGGWGSGRFSEMAGSDNKRTAFANDCKRVVREYGLDGIDIDWEYPTQSSAGISSSPEDSKNFTLLMRDIRKAIGKGKLLTMASVGSADFVDFKSCIGYMDFVNVMSYDMGNPPYHHSALYDSSISASMTTEKAVAKHLGAGVPKEKLVMGMPFYGRGGKDKILREFVRTHYTGSEYTECWSDSAQVPYIADKDGKLVLGYENKRSLAVKCQYVIDNKLRGGMYWDYESDNCQHDAARTLHLSLMKNGRGTEAPNRVLVLAERGGSHEGFTTSALEWLENMKDSLHMELTIVSDAKTLQKGDIDRHNLILQLNYPPYAWSDVAREEFERYIDESRGAYIGFHHASLLGDFDGYPMWQWFSDFLGGIVYQSYIPQLADGTVQVERTDHPVMKGLPRTFVIPNDEWYTYTSNPRPNVLVLAHVDEASYVDKDSAPQWGPAAYRPIPTMGDHPVFWVNTQKHARNVYFQIGHDKQLLETPEFKRMMFNALKWTLSLP